ncbi:general substrate transporter [Aspergillus ambiguus]|uniref:general substrate transporter n=1 Tax=Aspergillus ambiguus TaxID=176160 RepID=UPI003CCD49A6
MVALLNAGCFFGALVPALCGHLVGRRHLLSISACFLVIGGTIQTAAQPPSMSWIYGGRVIAGFGIGMVSTIVPNYVAECSPKQYRGLLMGFFEMFLVTGGVLAYWTTYGTSEHLSETSRQWRIPLSLQIIVSFLVFVGSLFIVESPRWLSKKGRWEQAASSLCYLRGANSQDEEVVAELADIKAQLVRERTATEGREITELLQKGNLFRLICGVGIALLSIWTGHNGILYYGPTVFRQIGYTSQNAALLASGVFTIIKFVCTVLFLVAGVQVMKRTHLLIIGGLLMGVLLYALGAILKLHPPAPGTAGSVPAQGMMACIYLYVAAYSFSWGPLSWIYIAEIFPIRIRDYGMAISVMVIWLMNFIVSKITPIAVLNIGWRTWMMFGTFNVAGCLFALVIPETKGVALEDMDVLFGVVNRTEGAEGKETDEEAQTGKK